ncbi:exonuclease subunit SbcD [bacterium]|nr:exonuclease subunit SbcD [bacterium]
MRVLHTSDWHVGKRIGRFDRMEEHQEAIDRVVTVADDEQADIVLHSGDLFDRSIPPVEALRVGISGLMALASGGDRPVVVVAGNHDSPGLFDALAPLLVRFGVHLVGSIRRPDDGGVLTIETEAGTAHIGCFPFLRAAQVVDFMERADSWYGTYADRVRGICGRYADEIGTRLAKGDTGLLVGHFMVGGVNVHRGLQRGERELHLGEAYAADAMAVPTMLDYVALGHIHAPQPVPGAQVPAEYAGSLLPLDFGEAGEVKRVVVVDTAPDAPATVRSVDVGAGRPLIRAEGTWDQLDARDDLDDAYLDLVVDTDGPRQGLADLARDRFEHLVKVQARYERPEAEARATSDRPLVEVYAEYFETTHGSAPDEQLLAAFSAFEEEASDAAD